MGKIINRKVSIDEETGEIIDEKAGLVMMDLLTKVINIEGEKAILDIFLIRYQTILVKHLGYY